MWSWRPGAGAIGGSITAKLVQAGDLDVACVARGDHLKALQSKGLRLRTPDADVTVPVAAFATVADVEPPIGREDVVIIAVKVHQAASLLAELVAATAGAEPAVFCCTNGLDGERQALRHFPRTYAMLPCMFATHLAPGEVELFGKPPTHAWLNVGVFPGGVDAISERVAADLTRCGFRSDNDAHVMTKKRGKLFGNLGNALSALIDPGSKAGRGLMKAAIVEATAVMTAAGLDYESMPQLFQTWKEVIGGDPATIQIPGCTYESSTSQSLTRGAGDIECSYLNGEIALLGQLHGIPTPANRALQMAAERAASSGAAAGSFISSADLMALAKL